MTKYVRYTLLGLTLFNTIFGSLGAALVCLIIYFAIAINQIRNGEFT